MKHINLVLVLVLSASLAAGQTTPVVTDSVVSGKVVIHKDPRVDILASKQGGVRDPGTPLGSRAAKGYRLMILNTNDRDLALRVRSQLLQRFPEQKIYMSFKPPYIQLKFGNFVEKGEAERYKTQIKKSGLVTTNIYAVPEIVEVKPPKEGDKEKKEGEGK
jgi:SPOR domain